jgi:hypothetical protein
MAIDQKEFGERVNSLRKKVLPVLYETEAELQQLKAGLRERLLGTGKRLEEAGHSADAIIEVRRDTHLVEAYQRRVELALEASEELFRHLCGL